MRSGYAGRIVTKAPNWHGLVALDTFFNNLTTGLFIVAALGELAAPERFAPVARAAWPIALVLLLADLVCLVLDLGDPLRFHHMLRIFKPASPMSLGTWCLTVYALPVTLLALLSLLPIHAPDWLRRAAMIVGLLPALGTALYKGVLFSTTAQPGWKDARWLGGYFAGSAVMLGAAQLLLLAGVLGQPVPAAALRPALELLLLLNLLTLLGVIRDLGPTLARAYGSGTLGVLALLVVGGGVLMPLYLLALGGVPGATSAAVLILLAALLARDVIVRLPHQLAPASGHGS